MESLYVGEGEYHGLKLVEYSTMYYKILTREKIIEEEERLKS